MAIKKWTRLCFLMTLAVLIALISNLSAAEQIRNPLAIDMVIVIENSQRMNVTNNEGKKSGLDANGLRFDAASALISMCDAKFSRAAYFMFADDLYVYSPDKQGNVQKITVGDLSLFDISIPTHKPQRENIMSILNGDKIRSGYGTKNGREIGEAIWAAVDLEMREPNNGNRKVILLLTAGNNQLSNAGVEKAREAKAIADENGIEIYCVALNDSSATSLLQELATKSSNYQFASSPEDLVDVFRNFFADMIGADPLESKPTVLDDGSSEIKLDIPNDSVAEVNIIIPKKQVDELTLVDAKGKELVKTEDNILVSTSRNFMTYKLIDPKAQTYTLKYTSKDEQSIVVQYVFSYGVQIRTKVNAEKINKNDAVIYTAEYFDGEIPTNDEKLYNIPATLTIWKDGHMIEKKEMEIVDNHYQAVFESLESYGIGNYTATIHLEGDGMLRDSDAVGFELINNSPELIDTSKNGASFSKVINMPKQPESYDVNQNGTQWDLSEYVKDINGDELIPEIVSNTSDTDAVLTGMTLKVTPKKNTATTGEIKVIVRDKDGGESPELVFDVEIENYEDRYDTYTASFDAVKGLEKNSECEIVLRLYDANGNEVRGDSQLPETVEATITPTVSNPFKCILNAKGGAWIGEFSTDMQSQDYSVTATIPVGQKTITAQKAAISSSNKAPQLKTGAKEISTWEITINDPSDPDSYKIKTNTWQLSDFVEDTNGDTVIFTIDKEASTNDVAATVNQADQVLTITSKNNQEADGDIIVHTADNENEPGPDLKFHVYITSKESKYKLYTATLDADGKGKSRETTVTLSVFDENGLLVSGDTNLPDVVDLSVILDNEPQVVKMNRGEDGKWTGKFTTADKKVIYTISTSVKVSENVSIIPADLELSTENQKPIIVSQIKADEIVPEVFNIDPFLIWNNATGDIVIEDLNKYFVDNDRDKLTFTIEDSTLGEYAEATIDGNKLTIKGLAETSGLIGFKVKATDNEQLSETSDLIQFSIKSLKKQGIIIIGLAVAALIVLFILYQIMKPAFHNQYFEVATRKDNGPELPQNKSVSMKGKKPQKLSGFTTSSAKQVCGTEISTSMLNNIILKPGYSNRVKIKLKASIPAEVSIGTTKINVKKSGTVSPNGTLSIKNNGTTLQFHLKKAGTNTTTVTQKPAAANTGTSTAPRPQRSGRT